MNLVTMSEQAKGEEKDVDHGSQDRSSVSSIKTDDEGAATNNVVKSKPLKIEILLYPTGDAPVIKKKKWSLEPSKTVAYINQFLKNFIKCDPKDSLFLYVNQSFAPSPDTEVGSLYECFGSDGKLALHYCKTQAWG